MRTLTLGKDHSGKPTYLFWDPRRVHRPLYEKKNGIPSNTTLHCAGPEANLWTVGVIIYMFMTGEDISNISKRVDALLQVDSIGRDNPAVDKYICKPSLFPTFLSGEEDYSPELKALVADCCRLEPLKRPSADRVKRDIEAGIVRERDRLFHAFDSDQAKIAQATRMAFTNEQWHEIPQGPFAMVPMPKPGDEPGSGVGQFWFEFHHSVEVWQDPDAPPILVPGRTFSKLPRGERDWKRPFTAYDMVMYADQAMMNSYWKGPALPRGGRAQGPPGITSIPTNRSWNDGIE